jgi:hypothetical protein
LAAVVSNPEGAKMKLKLFSLVPVIAMLAACAVTPPAPEVTTAGKNITAEDVATFKVGETTEPSVLARYGTPDTNMTLQDGSKVDTYTYTVTTVTHTDSGDGSGMLLGALALGMLPGIGGAASAATTTAASTAVAAGAVADSATSKPATPDGVSVSVHMVQLTFDANGLLKGVQTMNSHS